MEFVAMRIYKEFDDEIVQKWLLDRDIIWSNGATLMEFDEPYYIIIEKRNEAVYIKRCDPTVTFDELVDYFRGLRAGYQIFRSELFASTFKDFQRHVERISPTPIDECLNKIKEDIYGKAN